MEKQITEKVKWIFKNKKLKESHYLISRINYKATTVKKKRLSKGQTHTHRSKEQNKSQETDRDIDTQLIFNKGTKTSMKKGSSFQQSSHNEKGVNLSRGQNIKFHALNNKTSKYMRQNR